MPSSVATLAFAIGITGLFWLDRDREARTSKALWIPVVWLLISSSRNVSEWLQIGAPMDQGDRYLEGSPLDRNVLGTLLLLGIIVLFSRRRQYGSLFRANIPVVLYFFYCGLSMLWAAYPFVAFKRWNRALGDVVMVLVVLTDPDQIAAIKRILARVGFLVLPLSVLLIRYYPNLGRAYGSSDGAMYWTGVAEGKNTLGIICLIFGLGSVWRFLDAYQGREEAQRTQRLLAHGTVITMALWLLWEANSMTSISCFCLASSLMVATTLWPRARRPAVVYFLVVLLVVFSASVLFSGGGGGILRTMGRNPTLTGRTEVWNAVLQFTANPLLGAGYESFWLGDRLNHIQQFLNEGGINQCHNGYLEVYVNLGWIGLTLLAVIVATGCRRVVLATSKDVAEGRLRLAYFLVGVIFSFTEAGFKMMSPIWFFFLLAVVTVPKAPTPERSMQVDWDVAYNFVNQPEAERTLDAGFRWELN